MKSESIELYTIREDVVCIQCGNKGAIQSYGKYYPNGLGEKVDKMGEIIRKIYEQHRDNPYMSHTMGFGGTIPHKCLNCGNEGLIDRSGLEGYKMAFESIGEGDEE